MSKWKTINKAKLQAEIDRLAGEMEGLAAGQQRTADVGMAVRHATILATHNALVAVYNSLD